MPENTNHSDEFTPRQQAVLESALGLLVAGGEKALTTAGVARAASCSKESLYKWFGDREGLLAAMISYQASKVRTFTDDGAAMNAQRYRAYLLAFAKDLLNVLAGDVSLALNRLAIGQASQEGNSLAQLLIERGRKRIDQRAGALLEAGKRRGLIHYDDRDDTYHVLYGLIVRDLHVRMLLGDAGARQPEQFEELAEAAVAKFFALYAAREEERVAGV